MILKLKRLMMDTNNLLDNLLGKKVRFIKNNQDTLGKVPGELIFVGDKKQDFVKIRLIAFNENELIEKEISELSELNEIEGKYTVTWLNVDGLHDISKIKEVAEYFSFPELLSEDIVHTGQRPRFEEHPGFIFGIQKMLRLDKKENLLDAEQFSFVQNESVLITFQESVGDFFEPVRERIRKKLGRIRLMKPDYLAYCLVDTIVDHYISMMEYFGEKIEDLEDKIILEPKKDVLTQINRYKVELNYFRKTMRPARDSILLWKSSESILISEKTKPFIERLNELIIRAHENVENYKSMLSEQLTVYSTNVSSKMNDIMKVLTVFSAMFIPLTFIAGIYGTNFEYFPELKFKYSYFVMWGVMLSITILMLIYFKRKKWF